MLRLLLGLVKGVIIGAGVGYGAFALGLGGAFNWVTYGAVGALVGLLVGRPIWSHILDKRSTAVTSILKAAFGFGIGCGLYALIAKVWGGGGLQLAAISDALGAEPRDLIDWQFVTGGAIGALYGAFVEVDDAPAPAEGE